MSVQDMIRFKTNMQNVLGKNAKIPDPKFNIAKISADFTNAHKEYSAAVTTLQAKILAFQNAASTVKNSWKQYQDQIDASNFGLNEDDPASKALLDKGSKYADAMLTDYLQQTDTIIKNLDELEKHSLALAKYKSPA